MSDRELLFNRFSILDVLRTNRDAIPTEILGEKRDYLLNVNEEIYLSHLVDKHTIVPLQLQRDSIELTGLLESLERHPPARVAGAAR